MNGRLRRLGIVLAVFGLVFTAGGAYAAFKVQEGYRSLNAFSAAQNVKLAYNDQGQLDLRRHDGRGAGHHGHADQRLGLPGGGE